MEEYKNMVDMDAIRKRHEELQQQSERGNKNIFWKAVLPDKRKDETKSTNSLRIMPLPTHPTPFVETYWHYNIGGSSVICPRYTDGAKKCPICDYVKEMYDEVNSTGNEDLKKRAGQIRAKMKVYVPMIDRNADEPEVRWYGMSKTNYQTMMSFLLDPDIGDITSLTDGFDLKLSYTLGSNGIPMPRIDAARRPTPLLKKRADSVALLEQIPDLEGNLPRKTQDELVEMLDKWMNPGDEGPSFDEQVGDDHLPGGDREKTDSGEGIQVSSLDDLDEILTEE